MVYHGLAGEEEDVLIVAHGVLLTFSFPHLLVVSRLVEVGPVVEHECLERNKDLEDRGPLWVPHLGSRPGPGVQEAQANVSRLIQVRVQAESS